MRRIPRKLRAELAADPYYKSCALAGLHNHVCSGRITWEHALIFEGRQLNRKFAIIPLCARAHEVDHYQDAGTMNKDLNIWIALNRATDLELVEISKAIDYKRRRDYLNSQYGIYVMPVLSEASGIDYGRLISPAAAW